MDALPQDAPALPTKSTLRSSRFLEPIDSKATLDEQPPLSPATAPHSVYLSSEEDASSSADDFSDYEFDSDSDLDPESPNRKSHEDTARVVSFVFYGKPALVDLPPRSSSPGEPEDNPKQKIQRTGTDPEFGRRRTSVSSTASSSILSTFSRSSTFAPAVHTRQKPSFLSIDPFANKNESEQPHESERPRTPKGASSMLKRTFSLARKRSKPHLNQAATQSQDVLTMRPQSVDQSLEDIEAARAKEAALKASRRKTIMMEPPPIPETTEGPRQPQTKGHSRLRSGLSISMGRRRP